MKVSNVGPGKSIGGAARKKSVSGKSSDFADQLTEAARAGDTGGVAAPSGVGNVDSILAVQEVAAASDSSEERSRRRAQRYGGDLLDRLDALRHDILIGAVSKAKMADLAKTMRAQRGKSDDSRLNGIIDEIELRAEVELAKLTREV